VILQVPNNEEDGEHEDDDEEDFAGGKLGEDDQPGRVMGTISKTVKYHRERFWLKQTKLDKLTQPGWGDAADDFRESDKKHRTTEWKVPAVVQLQTADDAASSAPKTFGEPIGTLHCVPGRLQMLQLTSPPANSHMHLGSRKAGDTRTQCVPPAGPTARFVYDSEIIACRTHKP